MSRSLAICTPPYVLSSATAPREIALEVWQTFDSRNDGR